MLDQSTTESTTETDHGPAAARRRAVATLAAFALVAAGFASAAPAAADAEFRSFDGTGNNVANPDQGSAGIELLRMLDDDYGDGVSTPAGADRKSARIVSNMVSFQLDSMPNAHGATSFLWQWGQFLDHDLTFTPLSDPAEPFNIAVPTADPFFDPGAVGGFFLPFTPSAGAFGASRVRERNSRERGVVRRRRRSRRCRSSPRSPGRRPGRSCATSS